ncbi:MAG: LytR C-terminal domain-containing protein [Mycobacteriales bacterium]
MTLGRARALVVLGIMALIAVIAVVWTITRDTRDNSSSAANTCAVERIAADIPKPAAVKLQVFNATDRDGLATTVADAFRARGFNVVEVGNSPDVLTGTAEVRFGAKAVGAAHLVRAQIPDAQSLADNRQDDIVVLVLGPDYVNLTSAGNVDSVLKTLGEPVRPKLECEKTK